MLPDLAAGCSMADMANYQQVVEAWDMLAEAGVAERTVPVTYMNSSAAITAFTGELGGTVCTSSNAERALRWAFDSVTDGGAGGEKVRFMPDQHLGRNTAVLRLGIGLDEGAVFNPHQRNGGLAPQQLRDAKMILWQGHCSVHGRFAADHVAAVRRRIPGVSVLVHPSVGCPNTRAVTLGG